MDWSNVPVENQEMKAGLSREEEARKQQKYHEQDNNRNQAN